ncbi:MAG: phosphoribosylformylglycinamidine synthase subunit PurS [Candidatus Nanopelagicales bacterium]
MARVVVDVMLKPEILDPQGRAVLGAIGRLGLTGVASVRQGKRFEIEVDGELDEDLAERLDELAGSLLSNPVIEDYEIYEELEPEADCDCEDCTCTDDAGPVDLEAPIGTGPVEGGSPVGVERL